MDADDDAAAPYVVAVAAAVTCDADVISDAAATTKNAIGVGSL